MNSKSRLVMRKLQWDHVDRGPGNVAQTADGPVLIRTACMHVVAARDAARIFWTGEFTEGVRGVGVSGVVLACFDLARRKLLVWILTGESVPPGDHRDIYIHEGDDGDMLAFNGGIGVKTPLNGATGRRTFDLTAEDMALLGAPGTLEHVARG